MPLFVCILKRVNYASYIQV